MDFTLTDEQQAIADLAHRILSEQLPPERLRELEQTDDWFADAVWAELGKADLLGIALPEADGGGGYGILEACLIAEQVGRTVAPVPYLSSIVASALPLAHFGSDAQRKQLLPDVIAGTATLTIALYEPNDVAVPVLPTTQATPDGEGWRLDGEKSLVVGADRAAAILVPARTGESTSAVFLVAPTAAGVSLERETAVTGEPQWTVRLDGVVVDGDALVGGPQQGAEIVDWTSDRLAAAICATQTGVCEEALAITGRYVSEREQFGSKLGTFQAVAQRVADAYIDTEAIRLTALQAVWRLSEGLDAHDELMTAKFWAADGAQRVVHAAQHLHGGIGMDLDYPIHRYFRWAKVLELTLGGASPSLLRLGASLAAPTRRRRLSTLQHRRRTIHATTSTVAPRSATPHISPGGNHVKPTRASAALLTLLLVASAACSRDDDPDTSTEDTTTTEGSGDPEATALGAGGFGDLEAVCQEGDASGATAPGVTDDTITVGTMTDKGSVVPGLNEEMYDTAVAFTEWCNEHGGILGREIVLSDVDAKLFEYEPAVTEACGRDFALVGGGAVFDEDPNDVRIGCELPNIAGYVVSARGRTADLQVQPIPNTIYNIAMGRYRAAARDFADGADRYGIMASAIPSVLLVKQQSTEVAEENGFELVYEFDYQTQGETGWPNFVQEMQDKDVKILEFIGQPQNLIELTDEMDIAGWHPDVILLSGNFYDKLYEEGASPESNLFIQSVFHPLEMADDNKATQDYLDLMDQYNPGGKVALLGQQGLSSWLLFATAAAACGSDLTAECLLTEAAAQEDWTAGGLHARQTPGNDTPSPCFLLLGLDDSGFVYNEEATAPTEGLYNCDEENVFEMTGDYSEYGAPPPEG